MISVSRKDFINAIDRAIEQANCLTESEVDRLRQVGRTAQVVGRCWGIGPGCPMQLAGISDGRGIGPDDYRIVRWVSHYDAIVFNKLIKDSSRFIDDGSFSVRD